MGDLRTPKENQQRKKVSKGEKEVSESVQSYSSTTKPELVQRVNCNSSAKEISHSKNEDYAVIGMETDFSNGTFTHSAPSTAFIPTIKHQEDGEEPLLPAESIDNYFEDGEDIIGGEVIATADPWLAFSGPVASSSGLEDSGNQEGSRVSEWLQGVDGDSSFSPLDVVSYSPTESTIETTMSPATTENGVKAKGQQVENKNSVNQRDRKSKEMQCTHIGKSTSMPGMRKLIKGDIKAACSSKLSCYDPAISGSSSQVAPSLKSLWLCLQCGHIGCGDSCGKGGHAEAHVKIPRSDLHSVAVLFQGNLEKAWCYQCEVELDTNTPFFKDCISYLKRNHKIKTAILLALGSSIPAASSVPIVLPPPPPPAPKIDSPQKQFSLKGKQNLGKISSNSSSNRWNSGDWPLGLENLGNTCFMNSALQCLSRTRSLNDKLDLYASGNMIEIEVTSDEPCIRIINKKVDEGAGDSNFVSDECERFMERGFEGSFNTDVDNGASTPSSAEMDSLLDVETLKPSSKSEEMAENNIDSLVKERWIKELEQELKKPLQLRLSISKESMAAKLRHCFKAITRSGDSAEDTYDKSDFYCRSNSFPTVFSPRAVQLAVVKNFRLGQQHDSHELLRTVVDMMKKDQIKAFRLAIMQRYGVKKTEQGRKCDPKVHELLKMWDRKLYHKTFVDEIFGGELVTTQKCLNCNSVRRSHEEFLDLSLPIRVFRANPNPSKKKGNSLFDDDNDYVINRSVEDCLRAYTEPEFLTGSNDVECENCHRINLERLAAGASFEEVFPGVKIPGPLKTEDTNKSKFHQKKPSKKRQSRQAKIKTKLTQSDFVQESSDMGVGSDSSLRIVEDHYKSDPSKSIEKASNGVGTEEDAKSSKSSSLDDYVVIQSATMIKETENKTGNAEMEMQMDYDTPDIDIYPPTITGDNRAEAVDDGTPGNTETNLTQGLSTSLKSLSLIENGMDVDGFRPQDDEEMVNHDHNLDELMDDLDEPAVDGVGNASDIEDDECEGNGLTPLDLGYMEDKVEGKSSGMHEFLTFPVVTGTTTSTVADEGFSEGDNSLEEKNSQSLSGSSSRNSISETENVGGGDQPVKKIPVTKCPCSRQQLISRPPECLTLHLKRFQHTGRGSSKLSDSVAFPYILNLTAFCSEDGEDVTKPGYKTIFDEDGEVVYSLYGIVEHSGSLHFGHYVAYVKVASKQSESNERHPDKWYYISDSHVSSSSLRSVLSQDAYILFYERIRGEEKKERLFQFNSLNNGGNVVTLLNGYEENSATEWNSTPLSYSYDKPPSVSIGPQWAGDEENWEEETPSSSLQQVSSSNDTTTATRICDAAATTAVDSVSSSSLSYSTTLPGLDCVSSSTDAYAMDCSAAGPANHPATSSTYSSHPVWNSEEVQKGSAVFDSDIMDESNTVSANNYDPVSSSSDVDPSINPVVSGQNQLAPSCSKLDEVD